MTETISVPQQLLAELLGFAAKTAARKATSDILKCVRLDFNDSGLSVAATDLDVWLTLATTGFQQEDATTAILPCTQLHSLVSAIDKDEVIVLSLNGKRLTVSTSSAKYTFGILDATDWPEYPPIDGGETLRIRPAELSDALRFVSGSGAINDTRPYLNGVYVSAHEDDLRLVAASGHRFSSAIVSCETPAGVDAILPREVVQTYIELLNRFSGDDDVALTIATGKAQLKSQNKYSVTVASRLVDARFPDPARLVPYHRKGDILTINRSQCLAAVERLNLVALEEKGSPIYFEPNGDCLALKARGKTDVAEETIPCVKRTLKSPLCIGARNLVSLLSAMNSEIVTLLTGDPDSPVIVTDGVETVTPGTRRFSVTMPMRG